LCPVVWLCGYYAYFIFCSPKAVPSTPPVDAPVAYHLSGFHQEEAAPPIMFSRRKSGKKGRKKRKRKRKKKGRKEKERKEGKREKKTGRNDAIINICCACLNQHFSVV
jgi:hypothetical protein